MNKNPAVECFINACCVFIKSIADNKRMSFSSIEINDMREYFMRHQNEPALQAVQDCSFNMLELYHMEQIIIDKVLH